jgi:hypothetical protein
MSPVILHINLPHHNYISFLKLKKPSKCFQGLSKLEENSGKHGEGMNEYKELPVQPLVVY